VTGFNFSTNTAQHGNGQEVTYQYYQTNTVAGNVGDLEYAAVAEAVDGGFRGLSTEYYQYYQNNNLSSSSIRLPR